MGIVVPGLKEIQEIMEFIA